MLKNRFLLSNDFFDDEDEGLPRVCSLPYLLLLSSCFYFAPFLSPRFSRLFISVYFSLLFTAPSLTQIIQAPVTAFSSLGLDVSYARAAGSTSIGELLSRVDDTFSVRSSMPPHLDGKTASSAAASDTSSVAGSSISEVTLPPHLRGKYRAMSAAASCAASSTAGDISLPTTLLDTDSDAASIVNNFNAWGPNGEMQRRRTDSVIDSAASLSSEAVSAENDDPNIVGDWTRVGKAKSAALPRPGKGRFVNGAEVCLIIVLPPNISVFAHQSGRLGCLPPSCGSTMARPSQLTYVEKLTRRSASARLVTTLTLIRALIYSA